MLVKAGCSDGVTGLSASWQHFLANNHLFLVYVTGEVYDRAEKTRGCSRVPEQRSGYVPACAETTEVWRQGSQAGVALHVHARPAGALLFQTKMVKRSESGFQFCLLHLLWVFGKVT